MRATVGCRTQCAATATSRTTNSTAASTHTTRANTCNPGTRTGKVAAAVATIPVPMTDANQLGPRLPSTWPGDCSDDSNQGRRVDVLPLLLSVRGAPMSSQSADVKELVDDDVTAAMRHLFGGRTKVRRRSRQPGRPSAYGDGD